MCQSTKLKHLFNLNLKKKSLRSFNTGTLVVVVGSAVVVVVGVAVVDVVVGSGSVLITIKTPRAKAHTKSSAIIVINKIKDKGDGLVSFFISLSFFKVIILANASSYSMFP